MKRFFNNKPDKTSYKFTTFVPANDLTPDQFKDFYKKRIPAVAYAAAEIKKSFKKIIRWAFFLSLLTLIIPIFIFLGEPDFDDLLFSNGVLNILFLIPILLLLAMTIVTKIQEVRFLNFKPEGFQRIDYEKISYLKSIIEDLKSSMSLEKDNIQVWKSSSNTFLPSIQSDKTNTHHLILPMNFFYLLIKEPEISKSLIAHEFGHIVQKDTNLWLYNIIYFKWIKYVIIPLVSYYVLIASINFLIYLIILFSPQFTNNISLGVTGAIFLGGWKVLGKTVSSLKDVKSYRKVSEELADFAAIAYANGKSLSNALSKYSIDNKDKIHPPIQNRLKSIERVMAKYNFT
jgi:hypothetical protein